MSHPARFYIRYLMCIGRNESMDDELLANNVVLMDLPKPREEVLEKIREEMGPFPRPYLPYNPTHEKSVEFSKRVGVYDLLFPDKDMSIAQGILNLRGLREQVETMLMGQGPIRDLVTRLNARGGAGLTERAVELYEHFYYNISSLSISQWGEYLDHYDEITAFDRQTSLMGGPNMALHRLGFSTTLDSKHIMTSVMQQLYFRLQTLRRDPSEPHVVAMETKLAGSILRVDERLKESDLALKEVMDQFKKFKMEYDDTKVADVKQISSRGSYSGASSGEEDDELNEA